MSVLEGTAVDNIVYAVENLVPFALMLLHADSLVVGHLARSHDGFFAVDPRRDEDWMPVGHLRTVLAHGVEGGYGTFRLAGNLSADVPAFEALVVAVALPYLVDDILVVIDFPRHVAGVPVVAGVVEPEVELHAVFVGQAEIHVDQVDGGHVASMLLHQVFRRIGDELSVPAPDDDDGVDADGFHVAEILFPFLHAPVLMGYVV